MYKKISQLGLTVMTLAFVATPSFAQIAPQTCDAGVWKTMEDRARLETEREIMQNQNLIFKADSVLTYTCFDSMAAHASENVGRLFTHTTYWNGSEIIRSSGANSMDNAISTSVLTAMNTYITSSFGHTLLGGRSTVATPTVNTSATGTSYGCGQMSAVWAAAKCMNFMHTTRDANNDGFYPFKDLQAGPSGGSAIQGYQTKRDTRQLPTVCSGVPVPNGWLQYTNESRNSANGSTYDLRYQFGTPTGTAFTAVRTLLGGSTGSTACAPPVYTGITIILSPGATSSESYQDGICVTPGCTYQRSGTSGTCV